MADYSLSGHQKVDASGDDPLAFDTFQVNGDHNTVIGHAGGDQLHLGGSHNTIKLGAGGDTVYYDYDSSHTHGHNYIDGGAGGDLIIGALGDTLKGGAGADLLILDLGGAVGAETADFSIKGPVSLVGGTIVSGFESVSIGFTASNDHVVASDRTSSNFYGMAGADTLIGGAREDHLSGQSGDDSLVGGGGDDALGGFFGADNGFFGAIQMTDDGSGHDTLRGGAGNDTLLTSLGADVLDGGVGIDVLEVGLWDSNGVNHVNLAAGTFRRDGGPKSSLNSIEVVEARSGDNEFRGDNHANTLKGASGADTLMGGGGADALNGGFFGDAADVFVYKKVSDSAAGREDHIVNFIPGTDKIDLSAIDADGAHRPGNAAFHFTDGFHAAGDAILQVDGTHATISADTDGDGTADFVILLDVYRPYGSTPAMSTSDIIA